MPPTPPHKQERDRRWRLILGHAQLPEEQNQPASGKDQALDQLLSELYDGETEQGGLADSNPDLARWLGDVRRYFPQSVVQLLQRDAVGKLGLRKLLNQPELLAEIEPDVHLLNQLLALNKTLPLQTRETARQVVRQVVEALLKRLRFPLEQAIAGSLQRAARRRRPRYREINWLRTIHRNLRHYQPSHSTIIPETLVGYGRQRQALKDVILCVDQSGSMSSSLVYASVFGAVLASMPALETHLVLFDTAVVDMTAHLSDPVEVLFGAKLGGGTDIARAIGYAQNLISRPRQTILVLISDLFEMGNKQILNQRLVELVQSGVVVIVLLTLSDEGTPRYNRELASQLAPLGIPALACTPDAFPDLMAAALHGRDLSHWQGGN